MKLRNELCLIATLFLILGSTYSFAQNYKSDNKYSSLKDTIYTLQPYYIEVNLKLKKARYIPETVK